jgi:hypothetical protein
MGQMLPGDRLALDRLQRLAQTMDQIGIGDNEVIGLSTEEVDDLIKRLCHLRLDDPEAADRILHRINEAARPTPDPPG